MGAGCRSAGLFPSRLDLLAFGEIPPSRRAICRLGEPCPFETVSSRQQTTLQPNPTDRKPTLEAERQGLGCRNRERSGLFGLVVLGVNTQNFARFWKNSSRFGIFFAIFLPLGGIFLPTTGLPGGFSGRGLQNLPALQSTGGDIAVHGGRSFCHAMAVCRLGALPKGEAHHVGTLYNGCAGARRARD